jgi:thermostable 8-oxoguanine DNA glycosylase
MVWLWFALATKFKGKDGKVYEVDLKVADDEVIEAEIPLNKQPEKIQNELRKYYKRYKVDESEPVSELIAKMPNNPASINYNETKLFAQNLSKNGIKALRYESLSHPSKKKPSATFVVFDDKVIDILTKLGIAGAVILTPEMKGTVLTNSKLDT